MFSFSKGNAILTLKAKDAVKIATVRGTSFEPATLEGGSTKTEVAPAGEYKTDLVQFVSQELSKSDRPELTSAKVVVSGGMLRKYEINLVFTLQLITIIYFHYFAFCISSTTHLHL